MNVEAVHRCYPSPADGRQWLNLGTAPYCGFGASLIPRLLLHPQEPAGSRGENRGGPTPADPRPTVCTSLPAAGATARSILFLVNLVLGLMRGPLPKLDTFNASLPRREDSRGACRVRELSDNRPRWPVPILT